ncbi:berberine bridge enzyme-like 26 [Phalaenopsis equestris]|uniref:berberine bridge enzyme-like 26 n=1 Tax=Phalaenopsis equestris TaxID=78828 RepID=UPI0009E3CA75|nr:berberine bridge enzyme-like 26 [Phalaenopsis equestris]
MKFPISLFIILLFIVFLPNPSHSLSPKTFTSTQKSFLQCLNSASFPSNLIFTPTNKNYTTILYSSIKNIRTLTNSSKPLLILTPSKESDVQSSVSCSKALNILIKTRSGGHDFEGLSYASTLTDAFIIIDLQKLSSITIDSLMNTAWVQAGATLGELYYAIAMKSRVVGFPAGSCPTVGVGGHFSGGGIGTIMRAYGIAIDNIIDARIVNAKGEILDREAMGEDFFWALRGGGGASFGVILSYKINLVQVPQKVTVFTISKTLEEGATKLINKFQNIAYNLDKRIFLQSILAPVNKDNTNKTIQATFSSLFLGQKYELISILEQSFPELELKEIDCLEMSWIESILKFAGYSSTSHLDVLLDRKPWSNTTSFKNKSDLMTSPISEEKWKEIFKFLLEGEQSLLMIINPLGGMVAEVSENETPFPHRNGSMYDIQYITQWTEEGMRKTQKYLEWTRKFYKFMTPYVSKDPRVAYVNYRDLDLGTNREGNTSYKEASVWGEKYFKGNFRRLAQVKSEVDPSNFFRNEQSIPLLL